MSGHSRPSASSGHAPDSTATRPHSPPPTAQPNTSAFHGAAPPTTMAAPLNECLPLRARLPLLAEQVQPFYPAIFNTPHCQWPAAPSARLPPLVTQAQITLPSLPAASNLFPYQWPTALSADSSARMPPLSAQAQLSVSKSLLCPLPTVPTVDPSVWLP